MWTNQPQLAQYLIDKIKHDITRLHNEENARRQLNNNDWPKMEVSLTWIMAKGKSKVRTAGGKVRAR
jgi:hypothetical protein